MSLSLNPSDLEWDNYQFDRELCPVEFVQIERKVNCLQASLIACFSVYSHFAGSTTNRKCVLLWHNLPLSKTPQWHHVSVYSWPSKNCGLTNLVLPGLRTLGLHEMRPNSIQAKEKNLLYRCRLGFQSRSASGLQNEPEWVTERCQENRKSALLWFCLSSFSLTRVQSLWGLSKDFV